MPKNGKNGPLLNSRLHHWNSPRYDIVFSGALGMFVVYMENHAVFLVQS